MEYLSTQCLVMPFGEVKQAFPLPSGKGTEAIGWISCLKTFLVHTAEKYIVSVPMLDAFDKKLQFKITWKVIRWLAVFPVHSTNQIPWWSCLAGASGISWHETSLFLYFKAAPFLCCAHHQLHFPHVVCFLGLLSSQHGDTQECLCLSKWLRIGVWNPLCSQVESTSESG